MTPGVDRELRTYDLEILRINNISLAAVADQTGRPKGKVDERLLSSTSESEMPGVLDSLRKIAQNVNLDGVPK